MTSRVDSVGLSGISGYPVMVECSISSGLPGFELVGLPDAAVRESRERVRAAIKNSGFRFPVSRITLNLAPAGTKKTGTLYDLPILLGILAAQELVRLLDDDGAAILAGTHLKDIVDVAIADLNAVRLLVGLEKMKHFHGVPLHILRFHQKKAAVIRHKVLPFCQLVRLNVFVEFCSKLLYNPQISAK